MRKILSLIAIAAGMVLAAQTPALADPHHGWKHHKHWKHKGHHKHWERHHRSGISASFLFFGAQPVYSYPEAAYYPPVTYYPEPLRNVEWREVVADADPTAGRYCREYQSNVKVGGRYQSSYGTACMQPDGSWEIVSTN